MTMPKRQKFLGTIMVIFLAFGYTVPAHGLMTSDNFSIWADTIATGGNRSTSAGFIVTDTIGETATGEDPASANFLMEAGLPAIFEDPILLFELSTDAIGFGELQDDAVNESGYTLTVSTNADFGYTAQVSEDGNLRSGANDINDVADGEVTAGSEEYGIAVAGGDAAFGDDEAISGTPLVVATRDDWVTESVTTITHRASRSAATPSGSYEHEVTYVVIGNF